MPSATFVTSHGTFKAKLFAEHAPKTVENFIGLATGAKPWRNPTTGAQEQGPLYEGTIFHRVKPGYLIQGGGFTTEMLEKGTRPPILNEATNGVKNTRGTLGMARTRALRSATSQFYINLTHNSELDHRGLTPADYGYAVFGRVLSGMEVVDKIAATPTGPKDGHEDVPVTPVLIKSVTVKQ